MSDAVAIAAAPQSNDLLFRDLETVIWILCFPHSVSRVMIRQLISCSVILYIEDINQRERDWYVVIC